MLAVGALLALLALPGAAGDDAAGAKAAPAEREAVVVEVDVKAKILRVHEAHSSTTTLRVTARWTLTAGCGRENIRLADIRTGDRVRYRDRQLHVEGRCRKTPPAQEEDQDRYIEELDDQNYASADTTWSRPKED